MVYVNNLGLDMTDTNQLPELWMIWDSTDGDEIIIEADKYVEFCRTTDRDFWAFGVTKVELGKPRSKSQEIRTIELHAEAQNLIDSMFVL